jgi:hypothetical protein
MSKEKYKAEKYRNLGGVVCDVQALLVSLSRIRIGSFKTDSATKRNQGHLEHARANGLLVAAAALDPVLTELNDLHVGWEWSSPEYKAQLEKDIASL